LKQRKKDFFLIFFLAKKFEKDYYNPFRLAGEKKLLTTALRGIFFLRLYARVIRPVQAGNLFFAFPTLLIVRFAASLKLTISGSLATYPQLWITLFVTILGLYLDFSITYWC